MAFGVTRRPFVAMETLLKIEELKLHYSVGRSNLLKSKANSIKAVDGVSFNLEKGKSMGLVH